MAIEKLIRHVKYTWNERISLLVFNLYILFALTQLAFKLRASVFPLLRAYLYIEEDMIIDAYNIPNNLNWEHLPTKKIEEYLSGICAVVTSATSKNRI